MLIVITKDPVIVNYRQQAISGAAAWGPVNILNPHHNQQQATQQLIGLLNTVAANEPLCLVGHGNDDEAGGEGVGNDNWTWTAEEIANLLNTELRAKPGPILFEVCSSSPEDEKKMLVVGFGTRVQEEFGKMEVSQHLRGATIYAYHDHINKKHTLPDPATIGKSVEVQGSRL